MEEDEEREVRKKYLVCVPPSEVVKKYFVTAVWGVRDIVHHSNIVV